MAPALKPVLALYKELYSKGFSVTFITGRWAHLHCPPPWTSDLVGNFHLGDEVILAGFLPLNACVLAAASNVSRGRDVLNTPQRQPAPPGSNTLSMQAERHAHPPGRAATGACRCLIRFGKPAQDGEPGGQGGHGGQPGARGLRAAVLAGAAGRRRQARGRRALLRGAGHARGGGPPAGLRVQAGPAPAAAGVLHFGPQGFWVQGLARRGTAGWPPCTSQAGPALAAAGVPRFGP